MSQGFAARAEQYAEYAMPQLVLKTMWRMLLRINQEIWRACKRAGMVTPSPRIVIPGG